MHCMTRLMNDLCCHVLCGGPGGQSVNQQHQTRHFHVLLLLISLDETSMASRAVLTLFCIESSDYQPVVSILALLMPFLVHVKPVCKRLDRLDLRDFHPPRSKVAIAMWWYGMVWFVRSQELFCRSNLS